MCYSGCVEIVGLRELRQKASELVRRAEEGEEITITVAGRPGARLVPAAPRTWRRWTDVADLFAGPPAPAIPRGTSTVRPSTTKSTIRGQSSEGDPRH